MINELSIADLESRAFGKHFLLPGDTDYSFSNIPVLVQELFGSGAGSSLAHKLIPGFRKEYQNILILFVDAFGWRFSSEIYENPPHNFYRKAAEKGVLTKISSQFPSTTAVHVTTFHTGLPQRQSGVLEWSYYDASMNLAVEPLPFQTGGARKGNALVCEPSFLPASHLYPNLSGAGVRPISFTKSAFLNSPYNKKVLNSCEIIAHDTNLEAYQKCLALYGSPSAERRYINMYFPEFDHACHTFGPSHKIPNDTLNALLCDLAENFLLPLHEKSDGNTLCLFIADHGMADTYPGKALFVDQEKILPPDFYREDSNGPLIGMGSPRNPFFYIKPEHIKEAKTKLRERCGESAEFYESAELLELGAFGSGSLSKEFKDNLPEIIGLSYPGESVFWKGSRGQFDKGFSGHHGGLSKEEMETTLWAFEL
jgi:hypothetical protein